MRVRSGGNVSARVATGCARVAVGTLGGRVGVDTTISGVTVGEGGTVGVDDGVNVAVAGVVGVDNGETNAAVDSGLTGDVGLGATRPLDVAVGNGLMACVEMTSGLTACVDVGSWRTQIVEVGSGIGRGAVHPANIAPRRTDRIARLNRSREFIRSARRIGSTQNLSTKGTLVRQRPAVPIPPE